MIVPNRIGLLEPAAFAVFSLEAVLLGLLLLLPGSAGRLMRALAATLLTLGLLVKAADMATYQLFGRPFNPLLDARFPADGLQLLRGAIGGIGAYLAAALLLVLVVGVVWLMHALLGRVRALLRQSPKACGAGLSLGLFVWAALAAGGWPGAAKPFYDLLERHVRQVSSSMADLRQFAAVVETDPYANVADDVLLSKLKGKDVLLVFIESYGKTVLERAEYAAHLRPLLQQSGVELAAGGLHARSAFLTSPTYGGISWLAHGTLLSGLWIDSQSRYDRLVMSRRPSLNRLFRRAGWRTVAVQPAHTMDWPQGEYFGYDQIYAARDLGYQGLPFNWITMPDQYTLSALQFLERKPGRRQPLMAEIALISSHAPWTPLPQRVDWRQVADGVIFNAAREGDEPEAVWQSSERIRLQYRKSIEYVLATIVSYVKTYGDDNLVVLVLGDHQPAAFVTGDSPSHDVPVHLLCRDVKLIEAVKSWGWSEGMLPAADAPVWGMHEMRDRFIAAFSGAAELRN
ncbi:sulfatase-like hydrolase/transferase [Methylomonas sp. SURF-2]|uniref:Sulfatase-like hydrolase/transferase n=1 Tax=Methylomonas subterranea TaxID=2952225 RepID=A0ABT1TL73_9GAMM|nr:sulfatase-like hydrolase/transferase [Methylomonas sp. SURF-2]MCQ8106213.1 sulfatase-like hydrolase/transferase [Methylomonas sp. SURF-2]